MFNKLKRKSKCKVGTEIITLTCDDSKEERHDNDAKSFFDDTKRYEVKRREQLPAYLL